MADVNFVMGKGVDNHFSDPYLDKVLDSNLTLK